MTSSLKRFITLGVFLVTIFLSQNARAQTYGVNLLVNGDAEANAIPDWANGTENGVDLVPAGWTRSYGKFITVTKNNTYWAAYGAPFFVRPGPGITSSFFVGGHDSTGAQMYQFVDLSAFSAGIDQGLVRANLDARIGTYTNQHDSTEVTAYFYDGLYNYLGLITLGEINNQIYNSPTVDLDLNFVPSARGIVPVGTRHVAIYVTGRRYDGSDDDSYVDDLSFKLVPRIATVALGTITSHWEQITNSSGKRINWQLVQVVQVQNTQNVPVSNVNLTGVTYNSKSAYVSVTVGANTSKFPVSTAHPLSVTSYLAPGNSAYVSIRYLYPNSANPPLVSGARYPLQVQGIFTDAETGRPGSFNQSIRGVAAP